MDKELIESIRNMSDDDLNAYLKSLTLYRTGTCYMCGRENANYVINVKNKRRKEQKKLCNLCEDCYKKLLKTINIQDIEW